MNDSNDDGVFPTFSLEELTKLKKLEDLSKDDYDDDDYYSHD